MFGYQEGGFPITEDVTGRTIALSFFNSLKEEQIDYVVEKLKEGIARNSYLVTWLAG
jgi:perosamine synthetase